MRIMTSALLFLLCAVYAHAAPRPHIVVFLADDLSWIDCSIYGQKHIRTPNMERLAADGMTFTHAFVASPSCAPSRGAMLTGLTPARNGAMFNHTVPDKQFKRWPAYFKDLGYEVVAIGKVAHYATVRQYGFDHISHFNYHQDDCIEVAAKWLEQRNSEKPLCLLVGTNWPHVPWPEKSDYRRDLPLPATMVDTPETREHYARYAQAVTFADRDLGLIFDAARNRLGQDVLFLFSADHGSQLPFGKWNCYDLGIRSPLVVAWKDKVRAGSRSDAMVSWIDFLPTLLEAAGDKAPGNIDGRSFLPVLLGQKTEHRDRIFTTHSGDGKMNEYPIRSVRTRDWKYIRNLAPDTEHHTHIDKGNDGKAYWTSWELKAQTDAVAAAVVQRYHRRPAEELYDLTADPHEQKNLAADPSQAQRLAQLRAELDASMKAEGDLGLETEAARKPKP